MPSVPNSPLNDDHLKQLNAALDMLKTLDTQIILAKQAGLDVSAAETEAAAHRKQILQLKNTYFPGY